LGLGKLKRGNEFAQEKWGNGFDEERGEMGLGKKWV
jgi:hypothetical protein